MAKVNIKYIANNTQFDLVVTFAGAATSGQAIAISGTVGNANVIGLTNYASGDNIVNSTAPFVTDDGLSFQTDGPSNANDFNIYSNGPNSYTSYRERAGTSPINEAATGVTYAAVTNANPTATNDSFTVNENSGATIVDVLGNDSFAPDTNETLTVTAVTQPTTGGSVTLTNGVVRFTPTAEFSGQTTFGYTISDGNGGTASATVTATVAAVNVAPALTGPKATLANGAENDPYTVTKAQLLQGYTDGDNDTLSVNTLSTNHGSITSTDGGLTYTITPDANYDGPVTISYNVSDGTASIPASLGFTLTNVVQGTAGSDVLASTAGPDIFRGLGNNDTASYANAAGAVTVNLLDPAQNTGEAAGDTYDSIENLTGGASNDSLTGNGNANLLDGNGGADTLAGLGGNDSYIVDNAGDQVVEQAGGGNADAVYVRGNVLFTSFTLAAGADIEVLATTRAVSTRPLDLTGNEKDQTLYGNAGANVLDGKGGTDTLNGFGGEDTFVFSTTLGADNVDRIVDFVSGEDLIQLSKSVFGAISRGALDADAFKDLGVAGATVDGDDRILYDAKGRLFYDADGAGGDAAVLFAKLSSRPALTHDDILVI